MIDINKLTIGQAKELVSQLGGLIGNEAVKEKTKEENSIKVRPVVVFANNAIIFGYTDAVSTGDVKLTNARNCFYYAKPDCESKYGFLGLAEYGPARGSKVGAVAKNVTVNACCIQDCSKEAVEVWESSKWG